MNLFKDAYTFWGILIGVNISMYLLTLVISFCWSTIHKYKTLPILRKDVKTSILVMFINILIAIPGYLLYISSKINFITDTNYFRDFLLLYLIFDITFYCLHYISHHLWPFTIFHKKHHTHQSFNVISLYVMHPIESVLFGAFLTICAFLFTWNLYSFLSFIFINWFLGLLNHLNTNSIKQPVFFCNSNFHKIHHQYPNKNYGFYTVLWDKIFKTFYNNDKKTL